MASTTDTEIRPFKPDDLPALHEIRAAAFAPVFRSFRDFLGPAIADGALAAAEQERADHPNDLCDPETPRRVFVVWQEGAPVGLSGLTLDHDAKAGEIALNCVHPNHAAQGTGAALYEHLLDIMRAEGVDAATAATGGDPSHTPARRAYEKAALTAPPPTVWLYQEL